MNVHSLINKIHCVKKKINLGSSSDAMDTMAKKKGGRRGTGNQVSGQAVDCPL
jgi:hypothetical protein